MATDDILDLEDKQRLELTLRTRDTIIRQLTSDGIPKDKDDREFLMKALDGLDRTVLSKTKLKIEDKAAQGQQQTTKMIADILYRIDVNNINKKVRETSPELDSSIQADNIVKDEMHIGVQDFKYNEFTETT